MMKGSLKWETKIKKKLIYSSHATVTVILLGDWGLRLL
jgi:hypothetical protein